MSCRQQGTAAPWMPTGSNTSAGCGVCGNTTFPHVCYGGRPSPGDYIVLRLWSGAHECPPYTRADKP